MISRKALFAIAIPFIAGVTAAVYYMTRDVEEGSLAIPVRVHTISDQKVRETVSIPGTTKSAERALLRFQVSGRVLNKAIKLGDAVKKGDVLASLYNPESEPLAARAIQNLEQLTVQSDQAARDFTRINQLYSEQAVTRQEWEDAKTRLDSARKAVEAASAEEQRARQILEELNLVAPFDGVITEIIIDEGEVVQAGAPAMRLSNPQRVELELAVSDALIGNLKKGQEVRVNRSLNPDSAPVVGLISELSPFRERGSLPQVVVSLDSSKLPPGIAVTAELDVLRDYGVSLPMKSVLMTGEFNAGVYRLDGEIVQLVAVRPLQIGSGAVVVDSDLQSGDKVIVEGVAQLFDGAQVTVMP